MASGEGLPEESQPNWERSEKLSISAVRRILSDGNQFKNLFSDFLLRSFNLSNSYRPVSHSAEEVWKWGDTSRYVQGIDMEITRHATGYVRPT